MLDKSRKDWSAEQARRAQERRKMQDRLAFECEPETERAMLAALLREVAEQAGSERRSVLVLDVGKSERESLKRAARQARNRSEPIPLFIEPCKLGVWLVPSNGKAALFHSSRSRGWLAEQDALRCTGYGAARVKLPGLRFRERHTRARRAPVYVSWLYSPGRAIPARLAEQRRALAAWYKRQEERAQEERDRLAQAALLPSPKRPKLKPEAERRAWLAEYDASQAERKREAQERRARLIEKWSEI